MLCLEAIARIDWSMKLSLFFPSSWLRALKAHLNRTAHMVVSCGARGPLREGRIAR